MENTNMESSNLHNSKVSEVVSMKEWIITMLILMVPLVNIVMPFVWAFGSNTNPSKANYFKAMLIMAAIWIVIWFLFAGAIVSSLLVSYS